MQWLKNTLIKLWDKSVPTLIRIRNRIDSFSKREIRLITFIFSLMICAVKFFELNIFISAKDLVISFVAMLVSIYLILRPVFYYFRPKFIPFFERHIVYSVYLLMYFFFLVPILSYVDYFFLNGKIDNFIINLIYSIIVVISIIFILIIIVDQFLTTIFHKRPISEIDLLIIFIAYFVAGISYGSLYYILDKMSMKPLFEGISPGIGFNVTNYINYIYTSLGALTSVGSGNIVPMNPWIRLLYVQETMLGFFLINFTMAYVFAIIGSKIVSENNKKDNVEAKIINYVKTYRVKMKEDLQTVEKNGILKKNEDSEDNNEGNTSDNK
jgi:hypothetical protein